MERKVNIRAIRERQQISQAELAKKVGVTPATLCKWESGHGTLSVDWLFRLAVALDVPVSDLLAPPA